MIKKKLLAASYILGATLLSHSTVFAQNGDTTQTVVAPNCLTQKMTTPFKTLANDKQYSLIQINEKGLQELMILKNPRDKLCGGFVNVTDDWQSYQQKMSTTVQPKGKTFLQRYLPENAPSMKSVKPVKYELRYGKEVEKLYATLADNNIWSSLTTLSAFPDRYAAGENGVFAKDWIKTQVLNAVKLANRQDQIEVTEIATGGRYVQPSLVIKLGKDLTGPGIVLGAHMDTLSSWDSAKPGADDDGSGSMTLLEVARVMIASHMTFNKPIYFIWYAAEEQGLIGSGKVVKHFKDKNIPVDAVLQFDMTGYAYRNDQTIWMINDHVNQDLTKFVEQIATTYVKKPVKYTACGYACSDHASWTQKGYKSAFPFESSFGTDNPNIHTSQDTIEKLSLSHMTDFAKIGIAFATELAEPAQSS